MTSVISELRALEEPAEILHSDVIRGAVDDITDEFPFDDIETLAMLIEEDVDDREAAADTARAISQELRRRLAAGVRKWPSLTIM
jgi:hypothetical protein